MICSLMPDMIAYCTGTSDSTKVGKVLGFIGTLVAGYSVGEYIYPRLDTKFNSNIPLIKACIKNENIKTRFKSGTSFFIASLLQSILSFAANKFLSAQLLPMRVVGWIVHGIRIPIYLISYVWISARDPIKHTYKTKDLHAKVKS